MLSYYLVYFVISFGFSLEEQVNSSICTCKFMVDFNSYTWEFVRKYFTSLFGVSSQLKDA